MAGFTAADAARWVSDAIDRPVDVVIANDGRPSDDAVTRYAAEHKEPLELGTLDPAIESVLGAFWCTEIARHDRRRLAFAVWSVLSQRLLQEPARHGVRFRAAFFFVTAAFGFAAAGVLAFAAGLPRGRRRSLRLRLWLGRSLAAPRAAKARVRRSSRTSRRSRRPPPADSRSRSPGCPARGCRRSRPRSSRSAVRIRRCRRRRPSRRGA